MKIVITHGILTKKHFLLWYEIIRRKKIDIYRKFKFYFLVFFICRKCDTPNVKFYLPTKKRFLKKLALSNTRRSSLFISKPVSHNFAEKLLATLMCLWCTLTCLWVVISRSSLRRLSFVIVIDSALMPPCS